MDVEREFRAVNRRIRAQIDRDARAALIRIGIDVEAEERAAAERQEAERQRAAREAAENLGRSLRAITDGFRRMGEAIARGYNEGAH